MMVEQAGKFRAVILAGERPGGSPLSHAFNVPASVMVPVAGKPSLARVIQAITDSRAASGGIICGPSADVVANSGELEKLLQSPGFEWLAPASGPAASALSALEDLDHYPALVTAGDHALLTPEIVDAFCQQALAHSRDRSPEEQFPASEQGFDLVIGLVPHELVKAAWPDNKRTVLKFANGKYCGSNLFAILNSRGRNALQFWQQAEADRKHPWRIARRFGLGALLRYLFRRLTLKDALQVLSKAADCRIGSVEVEFARAAVDVDSIEDQKLAEQILSAKE